MNKGCHCKYPLFLSDFDDTRNVSTDFLKKSSNVKLHENPYSESRVVPCTSRHDEVNSALSRVCEGV
jgi:hypothetical protein